MSFEPMSLAAVRQTGTPGTSAPSGTRWHLRPESGYATLQRLCPGLFHLSPSFCLVGLRSGFERMPPVGVRLASLPEISAQSLQLLVAAKQLVHVDSARDGLQGWWKAWTHSQYWSGSEYITGKANFETGRTRS